MSAAAGSGHDCDEDDDWHIHVGNLAPTTTEAQLQHAFTQFGEVLGVRIVRRKFALLRFGQPPTPCANPVYAAELCTEQAMTGTIELNRNVLRVTKYSSSLPRRKQPVKPPPAGVDVVERVKQVLHDRSEPVLLHKLVSEVGYKLEPSAKAWFGSRREEFTLEDRGRGSVLVSLAQKQGDRSLVAFIKARRKAWLQFLHDTGMEHLGYDPKMHTPETQNQFWHEQQARAEPPPGDHQLARSPKRARTSNSGWLQGHTVTKDVNAQGVPFAFIHPANGGSDEYCPHRIAGFEHLEEGRAVEFKVGPASGKPGKTEVRKLRAAR